MINQSVKALFSAFVISVATAACAYSQQPAGRFPEIETPSRVPDHFRGWRTNFDKTSIDLNEIMSGGPPKDGIPAIDKPKFVSVTEAYDWLSKNEPVISLRIDGEARAYPLQILIWHEIVNDEIAGKPVTVTFCPLCYTAIAFDRRLNDKVYSFGVSGMLRHSDMVMYDRETESFWQQISGEAIVGEMNGKTLNQFPSQIVSFEQFAKAFPKGRVLSRDTGHSRDYGRNPYTGYDDIERTPFLFRGKPDNRLRPMEKVVAVNLGKSAKAYPYSITREQRVIHDEIGAEKAVIFHSEGAASALDAVKISESKEAGTTGVFSRIVDGRSLTFKYSDGEFIDQETQSHWNIFGEAISGELKGKTLRPLTHGDYFAFAWLVFRPETEVYKFKN